MTDYIHDFDATRGVVYGKLSGSNTDMFQPVE